MKNRPTEQGHWWVRMAGFTECVKIVEVGAVLEVEEFAEDNEYWLEEFEALPCFERWLGPAHPPKHFEVIYMTSFNHDPAFASDEGMWVRLNDVKEYRLEDE